MFLLAKREDQHKSLRHVHACSTPRDPKLRNSAYGKTVSGNEYQQLVLNTPKVRYPYGNVRR
jgi:hypothetical protein